MLCSSSQKQALRLHSRPAAVRLSNSRSRLRPVAVAVDTSVATSYSGKLISPPVKGKHFLHLDDFSREELEDMLDRAKNAKAKFYARDESFKPFKGMTMAMIFTKPSARTRVSFETVSCSRFEQQAPHQHRAGGVCLESPSVAGVLRPCRRCIGACIGAQ
jgi:hypothetical protein